MATKEKQSRKSAIERADAELLATLGYKQEFQRAFTGLEVRCVLIWSAGPESHPARDAVRYRSSVIVCDLTLWLIAQTFGIAFSIIGLLPSIASVLFYSIPNGGPSAMVWGVSIAFMS